VPDHVVALNWLADPAMVDPEDDLLRPGTRERLLCEAVEALNGRALASVPTLHVIYLALSAESPHLAPAVGAPLAQLVATEVARRTLRGTWDTFLTTMPTDDLLEFLAVVDTWTARGLRRRRETWRRLVGAALDRKLGLA
jgi:hypothetical protein